MKYFLFLALLFLFFYAHTSALSLLLNEGQTKLTLFLVEMFLEPGQMKGIDIWITPHYKIIITQACNGMIPVLFLFASILSYPSGIIHKVVWMSMGYLLFMAVNTLRIVLVVHFVEGEGGRENFYWSHDLLGNMILMGLGVGLFIGCIKTAKSDLS